MKEKLPNSECYVYIETIIFIEIHDRDNDTIWNKRIFNFHELVMLWYWTDDQIKRYFSTRKILETMMEIKKELE